MHKNASNTSNVAESWDAYWHGTGDVGAYTSGGANHPFILAFWDNFFARVKEDYPGPRIIDIASGNGAVVERALAAFADEQPALTSVDISAAAVANIRKRFPGVEGIVSDARSIPLDSASLDIATSQFGVEYAGPEAIDEVARLPRAGGRLAFLLHNQSGTIHQECVESLEAIEQVQASHFIPLASSMLSAGFKAVRGAERAPYEAAAKKLAPALGVLEGVMQQYGPGVAGDTIARLYNDVGQIHEEIQHYEPAEVLDWLARMEQELIAYAGRMSSMTGAAMDAVQFGDVCDGLRARHYTLECAEPLAPPDLDRPLAWALIAVK